MPRVMAFSAMVGVILVFTQASGGVTGFVNWIGERGIINSPRRAGVMAWGIGCLIFIESSITALVTGSISRPIFDRLQMSREKLAYICDSTAAPVCILIPLNAWGAFIIGLLAAEGLRPAGLHDVQGHATQLLRHRRIAVHPVHRLVATGLWPHETGRKAGNGNR